MNAFHTIIAVERRKAPRQLAWNHSGQLHCMGESYNGDPNVLTAIEWDQISPWIIAHKGTQADFKVQLLGWPMVTKAEYEKLNPPTVL